MFPVINAIIIVCSVEQVTDCQINVYQGLELHYTECADFVSSEAIAIERRHSKTRAIPSCAYDDDIEKQISHSIGKLREWPRIRSAVVVHHDGYLGPAIKERRYDLTNTSALAADYVIASSHQKKQDCAAVYARNGFGGFAMPVDLRDALNTHRNQICYLGKDITEAVASPGLAVTSGINSIFPDRSVALIAANKPNNFGGSNPEAEISLIQADENSVRRTVIATAALDVGPDFYVESFHIGGYDQVRKLAYIEVHAGANSSATYRFDISPVLRGERPAIEFFSHGSVEYVDGYSKDSVSGTGNVIVSRLEIVEGRGREEVLYMLNRDGKEICKVSPEDRRECEKM